jgi:hypothetical protein
VIGNTTFYNFMKATTSVATTLTFAAGASQTVQNTLTLAGGSGNVLSLRSSTNGSAWDIDPQSNRSVAYLSVRDSNNTNGLAINATDGTSSGVSGNTGWDFGAPTVSSLGPTALVNGSYATDTTPTPTFTTADSDSNVAFQIQVGTDSSFSSNAVDYTSVYASPGSSSFTVGQAAGSGTYSTGSSGQTLSDASYYWRVRVGDGIATSSWHLLSTQRLQLQALLLLAASPKHQSPSLLEALQILAPAFRRTSLQSQSSVK